MTSERLSALSRSSSSSSISSCDIDRPTTSSHRARARFNTIQLTALESLFYESAYPTREERSRLAKGIGMNVRSVGVWFQNKRQMQRKTGLHDATNTVNLAVSAHDATRQTVSATANTRRPAIASRLSLDRVATRGELCAHVPSTPPRKSRVSDGQWNSAALWENMPSSPIEPPISPSAREYVEFGKCKKSRTLEWACAAARLAVKEGGVADDGEATADESEYEDPNINQESPSPVISGKRKRSYVGSQLSGSEETMNAALALCGLRG